jgi:hypothetical protein
MARPTYTIAGILFTRKADMEAHTREILHRYRPGMRLDLIDEAFVVDLLLRHPSADTKIGTGVAAIWVQRLGFGSQGFVVERTDGTIIDFSYKRCIRPVTHASRVKFAMRRAIADQIIAVKQTIFPDRWITAICPITGEEMTYHNAHVDHEPPATFAALVQAYLDEMGVTFDDIPVEGAPDGIGTIIPDGWVRHWAAWHYEHAQLRVISAYANLKLVR